MPIVERNDVDISSLFLWSKQSTIEGLKGKKIKIYIRLLGDADINRARVMALRKSAELRKKLRDPESNERLAYIPDLEEFGEGVLLESILIYTMRSITKRAVENAVIPKPKDPGSDASTERLEKFQAEVDAYPALREKILKDAIEKMVVERREELRGKDDTELYRLYVNAFIDELCETELIQKFKEYSVFFGTYADKKMSEKFFKSFDEVENLPSETLAQLVSDYSLLEVESDNLKK